MPTPKYLFSVMQSNNVVWKGMRLGGNGKVYHSVVIGNGAAAVERFKAPTPCDDAALNFDDDAYTAFNPESVYADEPKTIDLAALVDALIE